MRHAQSFGTWDNGVGVLEQDTVALEIINELCWEFGKRHGQYCMDNTGTTATCRKLVAMGASLM